MLVVKVHHSASRRYDDMTYLIISLDVHKCSHFSNRVNQNLLTTCLVRPSFSGLSTKTWQPYSA